MLRLSLHLSGLHSYFASGRLVTNAVSSTRRNSGRARTARLIRHDYTAPGASGQPLDNPLVA
jgi:hypothetical protein